jgi:hypothetical protein
MPQVSNGKQNGKDAQTTVVVPDPVAVKVQRDKLDYGYWVFSLGLLIVGGLQVWIVWKTLGAIKRQADLMKSQTDVQRANMRQWVVCEFVKTEYEGNIYEGRELVRLLPISIKLQAVNRTNLPLTITRIVTRISRPVAGRDTSWETFEVEEREILPPMIGGQGGAYPFYVPLQLEGEAVKAYQSDQFMISVSCQVFFEPAIGGTEEQSFGSLVRCGATLDRILRYVGKAPIQTASNCPDTN